MLTSDSLQKKINDVNIALTSITTTENNLNSLITKYNSQVLQYLSNIPEDKKQNINSYWIKMAQADVQLLQFYFSRDREILQNKLIALNFLLKRVGSYSLEGNNLKFSSNNDKINYNQIIDRINTLIKTQPPKTSN